MNKLQVGAMCTMGHMWRTSGVNEPGLDERCDCGKLSWAESLREDQRQWWRAARRNKCQGGVNEWYWRAVMREFAADYARLCGWQVALTPCQAERRG